MVIKGELRTTNDKKRPEEKRYIYVDYSNGFNIVCYYIETRKERHIHPVALGKYYPIILGTFENFEMAFEKTKNATTNTKLLGREGNEKSIIT